jgi:hypothetical protein
MVAIYCDKCKLEIVPGHIHWKEGQRLCLFCLIDKIEDEREK